jgi:hypothetical protein
MPLILEQRALALGWILHVQTVGQVEHWQWQSEDLIRRSLLRLKQHYSGFHSSKVHHDG